MIPLPIAFALSFGLFAAGFLVGHQLAVYKSDKEYCELLEVVAKIVGGNAEDTQN